MPLIVKDQGLKTKKTKLLVVAQIKNNVSFSEKNHKDT